MTRFGGTLKKIASRQVSLAAKGFARNDTLIMQRYIPAISIIIGLIGLLLGMALGSLLGRVGSFQILAFILRIPIILIRSPKELKSKWKMWQELRGLRRIECQKRQKKIKELKEKIGDHKKEIKEIKTQIRRVKWEFSEPKEV